MSIKKIDTLMCCDALAKLERMIENMTMKDTLIVSRYMILTIKSMTGKGFSDRVPVKIKDNYHGRLIYIMSIDNEH